MMRAKWISLSMAIALAAACGDDATGSHEADADTGLDARPRPDVGTLDLENATEDPASTDTSDDTDDMADIPGPADLTPDPDVADTVDSLDQTELTVDAASDIDREELIPTDDCETLDIPQRWAGTFEGDIDSNIPDMGGYTFRGPVTGEMTLEIWCIDEKFVVLGELDGNSSNCALENGCPFTATLDGVYDPETHHMEGEILDGVIDYSMVQVYAEGLFEGDLGEGPTLSGVWSGEKTGISASYLSWVEASGEGTWEATPE